MLIRHFCAYISLSISPTPSVSSPAYPRASSDLFTDGLFHLFECSVLTLDGDLSIHLYSIPPSLPPHHSVIAVVEASPRSGRLYCSLRPRLLPHLPAQDPLLLRLQVSMGRDHPADSVGGGKVDPVRERAAGGTISQRWVQLVSERAREWWNGRLGAWEKGGRTQGSGRWRGMV